MCGMIWGVPCRNAGQFLLHRNYLVYFHLRLLITPSGFVQFYQMMESH